MLTPDILAKSDTEHAHQVAFFAWAAVATTHGFELADLWASGKLDLKTVTEEAKKPVPGLALMHAIPNGGLRSKTQGAKLKAEGVKAGVPDIFLPVPSAKHHGLYIEMKKPSVRPKRGGKGGVSDEQVAFLDALCANGYQVWVCYGWHDAVGAVANYFQWVSV